MSNPLHVIIVEDSEDDTLLILRELRRGGYAITHQRVSTDTELTQALLQQAWDLVIADYSLPNFSAPAALQLLQAQGLDIPFIIVSGSIPEDTAVALMRAGANDYLMKYNLARLVPVVERELREAQERRRRCQAEQFLQENQERFRTLIENALDIIVVLDPDGTLQYVSPSIERVLGYKPTDSVGKNAFDAVHPDDQAEVEETFRTLIQQSLDPHQICTIELRFKHQTNSWRVLEAVCQRIVESDHIVRVVVNARDITERKHAEATLAQSEAQYRLLFENNPHPMWIFDTNTLAFLAVNDAATLKYGYSKAEFLAMTILDIRPAEDAPALKRQIAEFTSESNFYIGEGRHRKKNGDIFNVEVTSHSIIWENKSAHFIFAKDINDHKHSEANLQQSSQALNLKVQERTHDLERSEVLLRERQHPLSLAIESANAGLWNWDLKTKTGFWSDQNFKLLGYEPNSCETNLENWLASVYPDDRGHFYSAIQRSLDERTDLNLEYRVLCSDGSIRWLYTRGKVLLDQNGTPKAITGIQLDVTERKQGEILSHEKVNENSF